MDDDAIMEVKAALDRELDGINPNHGIAFGMELFSEFRKRGWITLEQIMWPFEGRYPTYASTHFAFQTWGIGEYEFSIGQDAH